MIIVGMAVKAMLVEALTENSSDLNSSLLEKEKEKKRKGAMFYEETKEKHKHDKEEEDMIFQKKHPKNKSVKGV